jgi:uncharacterized protein YodC (DUF2158 family)
MKEYKTGDLVMLKSGSPVMTVKSVSSVDLVWCQWFSGKKLEAGQFAMASLVDAPTEPPK